jgi:hypothetical protein
VEASRPIHRHRRRRLVSADNAWRAVLCPPCLVLVLDRRARRSFFVEVDMQTGLCALDLSYQPSEVVLCCVGLCWVVGSGPGGLSVCCVRSIFAAASFSRRLPYRNPRVWSHFSRRVTSRVSMMRACSRQSALGCLRQSESQLWHPPSRDRAITTRSNDVCSWTCTRHSDGAVAQK